MVEVSSFETEGQEIKVLGPYKPWSYHKEMGGDNSSYPTHSGLILDIKYKRDPGINYFYNYLLPYIKKDHTACIIPSHDPENLDSGLRRLVTKLAANSVWVDGTKCLRRHTKVTKLTDGGDRRIETHLNSIVVENVDLVSGRTILLMDDVTTTGHSLIAGKRLLLAAGAARVRCLALGRTTY